jgi:hypothetical protein
MGLAVMLAGCSAGAVIDQLPGKIGLPAEAPARPVAPYQYPAVHDMPPPRAVPTLTDEQQVKLEDELKKARDRQEDRRTRREQAESRDESENSGARSKP